MPMIQMSDESDRAEKQRERDIAEFAQQVRQQKMGAPVITLQPLLPQPEKQIPQPDTKVVMVATQPAAAAPGRLVWVDNGDTKDAQPIVVYEPVAQHLQIPKPMTVATEDLLAVAKKTLNDGNPEAALDTLSVVLGPPLLALQKTHDRKSQQQFWQWAELYRQINVYKAAEQWLRLFVIYHSYCAALKQYEQQQISPLRLQLNKLLEAVKQRDPNRLTRPEDVENEQEIAKLQQKLDHFIRAKNQFNRLQIELFAAKAEDAGNALKACVDLKKMQPVLKNLLVALIKAGYGTDQILDAAEIDQLKKILTYELAAVDLSETELQPIAEAFELTDAKQNSDQRNELEEYLKHASTGVNVLLMQVEFSMRDHSNIGRLHWSVYDDLKNRLAPNYAWMVASYRKLQAQHTAEVDRHKTAFAATVGVLFTKHPKSAEQLLTELKFAANGQAQHALTAAILDSKIGEMDVHAKDAKKDTAEDDKVDLIAKATKRYRKINESNNIPSIQKPAYQEKWRQVIVWLVGRGYTVSDIQALEGVSSKPADQLDILALTIQNLESRSFFTGCVQLHLIASCQRSKEQLGNCMGMFLYGQVVLEEVRVTKKIVQQFVADEKGPQNEQVLEVITEAENSAVLKDRHFLEGLLKLAAGATSKGLMYAPPALFTDAKTADAAPRMVMATSNALEADSDSDATSVYEVALN